jgi:EmrB/QacA subfamily drug resistance transporter
MASTPRSPLLTLIAAYLGLFVGLIDSNAVNLALPAIRTDLGGGVAAAQWTADAYNVAFAAVLLTAGSLGDRCGRRRMLRIGLLGFVVASLACALAPTLPWLLAARTAQGAAAAVMLPQGLAIAAAAFPDAAGRARATAAWAMAAASSAALGPVVGGVLTDSAGWRWIFWVNIPVGLLAFTMTFRYLPESRNPEGGRIDALGQALAMVTLGSLTVVLVEGRTLPVAASVALALVVVVTGTAFTRRQRSVANPMLPQGLLRNRPLVVALAATFVMTFGTYGLLLVNSLAFQQQRGVSALATALCFLPMPLTYLLLIPAATAVARPAGPRRPMTIGLLLMAAGMATYAAVGPDAPLWALEVALILTGAGLAFNTGPAVAMAMAAVSVDRAGLASGVVNLARLVGITMGIAVMGTVLAVVSGDAESGAAFTSGVRAAALAGGLAELLGAALVLRFADAPKGNVPVKEECHA